MESRIQGTTGLLALIGSPVGHSGSPAMYNYSFQRLGLDYVYTAFDIKEHETGKAIEAMRTFRMRGMNVTMPDKTEGKSSLVSAQMRRRGSHSDSGAVCAGRCSSGFYF